MKQITEKTLINQTEESDLAKSSGSSPPTLQQTEQRILTYLFTRSLPATEKQIQRGVRVRKSLLVTALRNLHKKRMLRRLGLGLNKCSFLYFVCGSCLVRAIKAKKTKRGGS